MSVSTGTLRTQDLLRAFAGELARITDTGRTITDQDLINDALAFAQRLDGPETGAAMAHALDYAADALSELTDRLNALAPEGHYFGSHPGDGADFGYWQTEDE